MEPLSERQLAALKEAQQAYIEYHALCFWSYKPDAILEFRDLKWVLRALMKEGDRKTFCLAREIAIAADIDLA